MSDSTNNKNCAFSEQAISYLYNEIEPDEKTAFETHLENCSICAADLTSFGLTRSAVSAWREIEFQTLATPDIEFSAVRPAQMYKPNVSAVEAKSLFARMQEFFKPATVWANGFAIFLIVFGLLFFNRNSADVNGTAQIDSGGKQEIYTAANETNKAENGKNKNDSTNSALKTAGDSPLAASSTFGTREKKEVLPVNKKTASAGDVKYLAGTNKNAEVGQAAVKPKSQRISVAAISAVAQKSVNNKQRVPKLNEIEIEEEDESSLRLAELLDEVGGK